MVFLFLLKLQAVLRIRRATEDIDVKIAILPKAEYSMRAIQ